MRPAASEIFTKFKPPRRSRGAMLVAVVLHTLAVFILGSILFQEPIRHLLNMPDRSKEPPAERVQFVRMAPVGGITGDTTAAPPAQTTPPPAGRGGANRGEPAAPLRAPTGVPTTLPPTSDAGAAGGVEGGRGSGSGAATGVTPAYGDPRIWVAPGPFVPIPRTAAMRADSLVREAFGSYRDSMEVARANQGRAPGDWTVEKGGQKWGVDKKWVHLGKVKIPTAVLALLPINTQGNPTEIERGRSQAYMRSDIMYQAQRSVNEDEFRAAVKRIRERKERERREAERERANVVP